jgi:hypothetical protein
MFQRLIGTGGRIDYLHDVHFGYTTLLVLRDVLRLYTPLSATPAYDLIVGVDGFEPPMS